MYIFVVLDRQFCYETLQCEPYMSQATHSQCILTDCTVYILFYFPSFLCQSVRFSALTVLPIRLNYFTFFKGIFLLKYLQAQNFVNRRLCIFTACIFLFSVHIKQFPFIRDDFNLFTLHSKDQILFLIEAALYYRWITVVLHDIYNGCAHK